MKNSRLLQSTLNLCLLSVLIIEGPLMAAEEGDDRHTGAISRLGVHRPYSPRQKLVMAFSPDGSLLACAGVCRPEGHPEYRAFPIWLLDGRSAKLIRTFAGHDGPVRSIHFSPSGKELASVAADDVACAWSVAEGKPLWHRTVLDPFRAYFSDNGEHLVVMNEKLHCLWLAAASGIPHRTIDESGQVTILDPADPSQDKELFGPDPWRLLAKGTFSKRDGAHRIASVIQHRKADERRQDNIPGLPRLPQAKKALVHDPWQWWTTLEVFGLGGANIVNRWETFNIVNDRGTTTVRRRNAVGIEGRAVYYHDPVKPTKASAAFFLPGARKMASPSPDDVIFFRDAFTGVKPRANDSSLPRVVFAVLDDGKVVAILWPSLERVSINLDAKHTVSAMERGSKKRLRTIETLPKQDTIGYRSVAFSYDGKLAAIFRQNNLDQTRIRIVECATGRTLTEFHAWHRVRKTKSTINIEFPGTHPREPSVVHGLFSPDGTRLAIQIEGVIRMWNVETGEELSADPGPETADEMVAEEPQGTVWALMFSPDASQIATLSGDATARLWDTESGKELFRRTHELKRGLQHSVAFSPDGKTLAIDIGGGRVEIVRCSDGTCLQTLDAPLDSGRKLNAAEPSAIAFSPDGRQLAVWPCDKDTLIRWAPQSGQRLGETQVVTSEYGAPLSMVPRGVPTRTIISPGLRWIASLTYLSQSLLVWDSQTGRRQYRLVQPEPFGGHCFSPDGRLLAFGLPGGNIRIFDVTNTQTVREFECDAGESFPRSFLDDGRILVSSHGDDSARFWDVPDGREIFRLDGHRIRACSRDGRYAACVAVPFLEESGSKPPNPWSAIFVWNLRLVKNALEKP